LIEVAKSHTRGYPPGQVLYFAASADDLKMLKDQSLDKAVLILTIQNIENTKGVFEECARVLKPEGKLFLVLNHPAFRIPKYSDWEWDAKAKIQYRRIDSYLSESRAKIEMHPSAQTRGRRSEYTISFHRPLQFYFKALEKSGFCVSRLEEWNSHKKSEAGPRAKTEDRARKEIPLFLFLEGIKLEIPE